MASSLILPREAAEALRNLRSGSCSCIGELVYYTPCPAHTMKSKLPHFPSQIFIIALAGLFALGAKAPENKVNPPELKVDASPVTQNAKPGMPVSYADIIEPVQKAVVSVHSSKTVRQRVNPILRQFFGNIPDREEKMEGLGSGVIVSADGYILTNNHVIDDADELKVQLSDEREFPAKVIGTDPKTDVAVIKIEAEKLPAVTLADSDKLRVGDVVFALGNPLGIGQTVTMGIVSARGRQVGILSEVAGYEDFIQTDAAINQGNSGGALVDARGRLVGINTAILSPSRGNIGIGFAIPINLASSIMHSLLKNDGKVQRGMLGVRGDSLTSDMAEALGLKKDQKGMVVTELYPEDGPAAKAGLKREDVIIAVNDKPVTSLQDLRLVVVQMPPGTTVKVKYLREGKEKTVEVKLGKLDGDTGPDELLEGVKAVPLTEELRKDRRIDRRIASGLLIEDVSERSPYREYLAPGVVILKINNVDVENLQDAKRLLKPDSMNRFFIYYRGVTRLLAVPVRK